MLKTMIDDLRAHRDRIDEAITALEKANTTNLGTAERAMDPFTAAEREVAPKTKRKYTRRQIAPIVTGSHVRSAAARRNMSKAMKARWAARRAKGFNNLG